MPWVKRRKIITKREIKIYVAATIFSVLVAVGINFVVDWGSTAIEQIGMVVELGKELESAEKAKAYLEKNVDAESLEYARKAYEQNKKIDFQKIKKVSGKPFDDAELEKLKKTYHELIRQKI
ncbi:hypothetical protein N9174_03800 [bacterium]|nr:hypothetical protein [bacterium]